MSLLVQWVGRGGRGAESGRGGVAVAVAVVVQAEDPSLVASESNFENGCLLVPL